MSLTEDLALNDGMQLCFCFFPTLAVALHSHSLKLQSKLNHKLSQVFLFLPI